MWKKKKNTNPFFPPYSPEYASYANIIANFSNAADPDDVRVCKGVKTNKQKKTEKGLPFSSSTVVVIILLQCVFVCKEEEKEEKDLRCREREEKVGVEVEVEKKEKKDIRLQGL